MTKYKESLSKTPKPIPFNEIKGTMDYRGLLTYAKSKGKKISELTQIEKKEILYRVNRPTQVTSRANKHNLPSPASCAIIKIRKGTSQFSVLPLLLVSPYGPSPPIVVRTLWRAIFYSYVSSLCGEGAE